MVISRETELNALLTNLQNSGWSVQWIRTKAAENPQFMQWWIPVVQLSSEEPGLLPS